MERYSTELFKLWLARPKDDKFALVCIVRSSSPLLRLSISLELSKLMKGPLSSLIGSDHAQRAWPQKWVGDWSRVGAISFMPLSPQYARPLLLTRLPRRVVTSSTPAHLLLSSLAISKRLGMDLVRTRFFASAHPPFFPSLLFNTLFRKASVSHSIASNSPILPTPTSASTASPFTPTSPSSRSKGLPPSMRTVVIRASIFSMMRPRGMAWVRRGSRRERTKYLSRRRRKE
jgi:hypothetical protein